MSKLEDFEECVKFVKSKIGDLKPEIGIVAGSGLKDLGKLVQNPITIPYHDIPDFLESGAPGHGHDLLIGNLSGCVVMIMTGRFHSYEGYDISKTTCGIRLMQLLGVKLLITTNAAGGINSKYKVGDIMVFEDHINMLGFGGNNPLVGKNDERLGCRFPSLTNVYDNHNTELIFDICRELKYDKIIHKGVYCCVAGPNFETRSECEMLRRLGVDAVGMSTVPEVLAAVHGGMKVIALSLITNESVLPGQSKPPPNEQEVNILFKFKI